MLFGGLNLADLGAHAEQLKTLVTGLLNSTQEANTNSLAALEAVKSLQSTAELLHGAVLAQGERLSKLESTLAMFASHTHSADEILPEASESQG